LVIARREFFRWSALSAAAFLTDRTHLWRGVGQPADTLDPNQLAHFVDALPLPDIAQRKEYRSSPVHPKIKIPYYRLEMRATEVKVHRDLSATRFWSYGASMPGPTFETRAGEGLMIEWANRLPSNHFLPIDPNIYGAEADQPKVRTVVHLHGAKTPPQSDGFPQSWIVPGESVIFYYPNQQEATMLWYHDHAMGISRLNVYAGLLGAFFIRDSVEESLNLPKDKYEIPLIICDRLFTRDAQLLYPASPDPDSPWVPDAIGNVTLVNGKLFPYLDVQPCKYRFRVLNASNARFYYLSFGTGISWCQIGTDQGFLSKPVLLTNLEISPGERADLILDFSAHRGEQMVLMDGGIALMQFRVSGVKVNDTSSLPSALRPLRKIEESEAVNTRSLTLNQYTNKKGQPTLMLLNGCRWNQPVTERPLLNSTEIWALINLTDDSHPIHLHLVRFQILDRRPFVKWDYLSKGQLNFSGPAEPPELNEAGWKDTVRADPKMVTRIIVKFEGYPGRYVWHCHVLEHEDNEMMRPYDVIADRDL
jgi:spore coat protein A, manganese oxidase